MSEPLYEDEETAWLSFLDRFDTVIYPTLFEQRGIEKGTALLAWSVTKLENQVESLVRLIEEAEPVEDSDDEGDRWKTP